METIGYVIKQVFAINLPFFGYTFTVGQVFIGSWLLALIIGFLVRLFK